MRLLLDTHYLVWAALGEPMPAKAKALIMDPANDLFMSAVSPWEMAFKAGKAPIDAAVLLQHAKAAGYTVLPIEAGHTVEVGSLPTYQSDPFDRLLLAQAMLESLTLLTHDHQLARYGHPVLHI
jgi:PIN domain nuclease of toxin-antitoxin system